MGFATASRRVQRVNQTGWPSVAAVAIAGCALLVTVGALPTCAQYQLKSESAIEYRNIHRRLDVIEADIKSLLRRP